MTYLIGTLAFIFILGAAVIIHEFGHFIVAKLFGIRVETFSVGFGKRLFGKRWGTTDYRLSAIPLGGYVKLGGDESNASIEGAGDSDIPPEEQFGLRPRWQRVAVSVAGPVMNIITALAIPFITGILVGVPVMPAPIVSHIKSGGAADVAGLQPGDRIVSFNGESNPTWEHLSNDALIYPGHPLPVVVERGGRQISLTVKPTNEVADGQAIGRLDMEPDFGAQPVIVGTLLENSPAQEAGLQRGDRIISVNGEIARNKEQVTDYIQAHKSEPIHLVVERKGVKQEITASVRRLANGREMLGFGYEKEPQERVGPVSAATYAVANNKEFIRLTAKAVAQAFTGERSIRDTLAGPVGIATQSSKAANEYGWEGVFFMLQVMSLNLGVFNLLPIPMLDGGAIFLILLEAVLGVVGLTLSMGVRERIQQVGFVALLLLMVFVVTNDLLRVASQWRNKGESPVPSTSQPAPATK